MIYIQEDDFNSQLKLLSFLAELADCNICAWLYPESSITKLAGLDIIENSLLVPATKYESGYFPKSTSPCKASTAVFTSFTTARTCIKENCDSIALYLNSESSWFALTIGHEGMCLVQDESKLDLLTHAGFNASLAAPSWW